MRHLFQHADWSKNFSCIYQKENGLGDISPASRFKKYISLPALHSGINV